MDINLTLQQHQSLSQSQIQSLKMLSLDSLELNRYLRDEYLENPLLDYKETVPDIVRSERISSFTNVSSCNSNRSFDTLDTTKPDGISIRDYITQQLDLTQYSKTKQKLICYLIDCLDEYGYFQFTPQEISRETGVDILLVRECLAELKALEPAGIFASDLRDCLISQLDSSSPDFENMKAIILNHLEDMAAGKVSSISRSLGLSTAEARKCMDRIQLLNPRPLSGLLPGKEEYVIPDIIFSKENGQWQITLNDDWVANYHLNDYYIKMLEETSDPELLKYFEGKLKSVQLIFSCIEQRRKTLLAIAEAILKEQEEFFNCSGKLQPMTMAALSDKLEIHPSTFSRAIKGKYIQYPGGSVLCKSLFNTAVSSNDIDVSVSQSDIKSIIQEMIAAENKSRPLSDQAIVKLLEKRNISISRRAVTKYRLELRIGSSTERKE